MDSITRKTTAIGKINCQSEMRRQLTG